MAPDDQEFEQSISQLGSISVWVQKLPEADAEAQSRLFERYREQLIRYAAARLRQMGVRNTDADDIAQEVFLSLFRRASDGKFRDLDDRDDLWLKLRRICGDRVKDAYRKRTAQTESAIDGAAPEADLQPLAAIPADAGMWEECLLTIEHALLKRQMAERHPQLPDVAALKIQGFTVKEIAARLELPKRTIERRLAWIEEICEQYASCPGNYRL